MQTNFNFYMIGVTSWVFCLGAVFQTYCDNDNSDGGWSYASTFSSNSPRSEWQYYSDHWTNKGSTLRTKLLAPFDNDKSNVKTHAFNGTQP